MNTDEIYEKFITSKLKYDNFFLIKIKNYKTLINLYLKNDKNEFRNSFIKKVEKIINLIIKLVKLLEADYYYIYNEYLLVDGFTLLLIEEIFKKFQKFKEYGVFNLKSILNNECFFIINEIISLFKIIEEYRYEDEYIEEEELDKLLNELLDNQLDVIELFHYINEIDDFVLENKELADALGFLDIDTRTNKILQNQAASKIQDIVRKNISKKQRAAYSIQLAIRKRLNILTNNLPLGNLLCKSSDYFRSSDSDSDSDVTGGGKDSVDFITELAKLTNNTYEISDLKLMYCNIKRLEFPLLEKKQISIKNSIFLNTSFKYNTFNSVKFENVKFYNLDPSNSIVQQMRKMKIINTNIDNINSNAIINNAFYYGSKFINTTFNKCKFVNNFPDDANIFNLKFLDCNIIDINKKADMKITFSTLTLETVDSLLNLDKFKLHNITKNIIKIDNSLEYTSGIYFSNTVFKNIKISFFNDITYKALSQIPLHFHTVTFINSTFLNNIHQVLFEYVEFIDCIFEYNKCLHVTFNNCIFKNCKFKAVNFSYASTNHEKHFTCILNSSITECEFNSCHFSNYFNKYFYNMNNFSFENTVIKYSTFAYCNMIMFKFNNHSELDNKMIMKNNRFVCNNLFGTNFSYCDLEGSNFSALNHCAERINWLGNVLIKLPEISQNSNNLNIVFDIQKSSANKEILKIDKDIIENPQDNVFYKLINFFKLQAKYGNERDLHIFKSQVQATPAISHIEALYITDEQYSDIMNIDIKSFLIPDDKYIKDIKHKLFFYHDYYNAILKIHAKSFYLVVPPTNFYNANIKTCNFQQVEGFIGFDFLNVNRVIDRTNREILRPDLNATNFTACIMKYANFENANLIGTVFQASDITQANFKNTKVNENTGFDNANFEEAINTDHINIGNLRQGANETHARAVVIVNNYIKLFNFFLDSKNYTVKTRDNSDGDDTNDYDDNLVNIIDKINNNQNISNAEKNIIKLYFTVYIPLSICEYLNLDYSNYLHRDSIIKIKENFKICVDDTFIDLLIKKYTNSVDGKTITWSWLELTYNSMLFLLKQTETYIYTFIQYYFNEVFNAHGPGSKSCPKGMIERLVTIHYQTAEFYNATFMDVDPNNSELIKQLSKYDSSLENDPSFEGDSVITKKYIEEYDSEKYKFNKLINLTKPNSNLPEKKDDDLGFTIDYSLSPANREEAHKILKMLCKSEEKKGNKVDTLDKLCIEYIQAIIYVILSNHKYKDEPILLSKLHPDLRKSRQFNKILLELKNYIEKNEIPGFRESVIYLYGTEESDIKSEDIKDYLTGGGFKSKSSKKRKTQTIKKSQLSKNKTSSRSKNKLFIQNSNISISENKIADFIKAREKNIVDKYLRLSYKEIQNKLEVKVDKLSDNQDKSKTISLKDNLMFNYIKVPKLQTSILYKTYNNIIVRRFKLIKIFNKFNVFKSSSKIDKQFEAISKLHINNLLKQELDKENLDKDMINKQKIKSKTKITPKIKSNTRNVLNTTLKKKISRRSSPIDIMNPLQDLNN